MSSNKTRWLVVLGWAAIAAFLVVAIMGAFRGPVSVASWLGFAFWGGLLGVWVRMGWRDAKSNHDRAWGAILVVALLALLAAVTAAVILLFF